MSGDRFPGLRAFNVTEAAIFNGRAREKQALFDLIMVERSVVMFAKSGAGKSSLLKAGIIPMLADLPYQPVYIRLDAVGEPLLEQVCRPVSQAFGIPYQKEQTLWEYLQKIDANSGKVTPILFFDQFEELFTLYRYSERMALISHLADVINETLPKSIHRQLISQTDPLENGNWLAKEKSPRVKFVFAIRSDLLSYLHELSDNIPSILRNRFELKGLHPRQAAEAIVRPAAVTGDEYRCPPFDIQPEALQVILDSLTARQSNYVTDEPEIESYQLQLVCHHLEEKMLKLHRQGVRPLCTTVETFGGQAGIERLLSDFYMDTLAEIPDAAQRYNARVVIEEELIKNKRRVSVAEASLLQGQHPIRKDTLRLLVDKRLLRREERSGLGKYYELAHDTLLAPILTFGQERRILEAAEKAHYERQEQAKKRRLRWVGGLMVAGLLLITLFAYTTARRNSKRAHLNYLLAESKLLAGQDNIRAFRLATAAHALEPDNTETLGGMIHAFYGDLLPLNDTLYAAPKYREYPAEWVKAVPGSTQIILMQTNGDSLLILDPAAQSERKIQVKDKLRDAALSPDGRQLLLVLDADSTVQLYPVEQEQKRPQKFGKMTSASNPPPPARVLPHKAVSVAISADGQYFTTNCPDGKQRLWSAGGDVLQAFTNGATTDLVKEQVAFAPDVGHLLVLENDSTAQLYPLPPGPAPPVTLKTSGKIQHATFSANSQLLSLLVKDERKRTQVVYLFDRQKQGPAALLPLDPGWGDILGATPAEDGRAVLLAGRTDRIRLMDREGKIRELANLMFSPQPPRAKAVFAQQEQVVTYTFGDKIVRLLDMRKNTEPYTLRHRERVDDLFFTPGERYLVVKTVADKVRIWDLKGKPVVQNRTNFPQYAFFLPGSATMLVQDDNWAWTCTGATSGCPPWLSGPVRYAVSWGDSAVLLQDTANRLYRIHVQSGRRTDLEVPLRAAALPPVVGGNRIALYLEDTTVWALHSTGSRFVQITPHSKVNALELSPDGRTLGLALEDSSVAVYVLPDTNPVAFPFHFPVRSLEFTPDSKSLLIGGNGIVYSWELGKPRPLAFLLNQQEEDFAIDAIACSPDGRFVATSSADRNIVLWNARGRWLHSFAIPKSYGGSNRLQFAFDGCFLLSQQYKNAVFRWPIDPEALIGQMNDAQFLTPEERQIYGLK